MIPIVKDVKQMYTTAGGTITRDSSFGVNPLANSNVLINQRESKFIRDYPTFDEIYSNVINEDGFSLVFAVLSFITITRNFSP